MYAPCYLLQSRGDLAISSHLSPFTAIQYSHSLPSPQLHTSQTALIAQVLSLQTPVSAARFSHTAKQKLTRSSSALTCGKWEQTLIKRLPLIKHQKENKQLKLFPKKKKRKFSILQTSNSYRLTSTLTQPHHSSLPPCPCTALSFSIALIMGFWPQLPDYIQNCLWDCLWSCPGMTIQKSPKKPAIPVPIIRAAVSRCTNFT